MGKRGPKPGDFPLPEWFDLGKYARAGELTLAEWYDQLQIRFMLYHRYTEARRAASVAVIRRDGIVDPATIPFRVQVATLQQQFPGNPGDSLGVCRMTGDILYEIYECLNKPKIGDEWRCEPIERHSGGLKDEAALVIDLSVSDTVLVDQFRGMLQAIRQEGGDLERRQVEPQQWAKYAVLPCLDLTEWARETGVRLGMKQLARTVFSDDLEGARWREIKKVTMPAMQRVMNPAFLKTLKSRIQKE